MASKAISFSFISLTRRSFAVAAAEAAYSAAGVAVEEETVAVNEAVGKAAEAASEFGRGRPEGGNKAVEAVYWMRDPKTGNWLPEDHCSSGEGPPPNDPADLRAKLIRERRRE